MNKSIEVKIEDIHEEINLTKWWVFPNDFHINQYNCPTKENALKIYKEVFGEK